MGHMGHMRPIVCILCASASSLVLIGLASAQIGPADTDHHHIQAGNPLAVRRLAIPSDTGSYVGYWVGGGAARFFRGDPPTLEEGTWGWDYRGLVVPRKVILNWWHGRRYQGGTGAYKTDGPKLHVREE